MITYNKYINPGNILGIKFFSIEESDNVLLVQFKIFNEEICNDYIELSIDKKTKEEVSIYKITEYISDINFSHYIDYPIIDCILKMDRSIVGDNIIHKLEVAYDKDNGGYKFIEHDCE